MPCVKCDSETQNGWRFCKPCMELDMAERKIEQLEDNRDNNLFHSYNGDYDDNIDSNFLQNSNFLDKTEDRLNLKNELKELGKKMNKLESLIKDTYDDLYVLLSKDEDEMIHLHGIFSNIENAESSFNKIEEDSNKYSKIINLKQIVLYKTQMDKLDNSFDTSLFDDCDMEIIKTKVFNNEKVFNE